MLDRTSTRAGASADTLTGVVVLGSLWGLSEVVLSGLLRRAGLPFQSGILTGIGIGLCGVLLGMWRKPLNAIGVAAVAVLCKQLVVPILHVSVMCKANSLLAVLLQGAAVAAAVGIAGRAVSRGKLRSAAVGAGSALAAAGSFYYLGLLLAPCPYLLSFAARGGLSTFMLQEGLPWAAFSALLFPLGHSLGEALTQRMPLLRERRPLLFYASSALVAGGCWLASALAIARGW